jgi:hypothetical protein
VTDEDGEEDEAAMRLHEPDVLSRVVDDDTWKMITAVDPVAVGHAFELLFGKVRPSLRETQHG